MKKVATTGRQCPRASAESDTSRDLCPGLYHRWVTSIFLCHHGPFWTVDCRRGQTQTRLGTRPDLLYGQLCKVRSGFSVKFTYTRMLIGTRNALTERLQAVGLSGSIQTAFVERLNLTLRQRTPLGPAQFASSRSTPAYTRHALSHCARSSYFPAPHLDRYC
jgi:hypothetical protein